MGEQTLRNCTLEEKASLDRLQPYAVSGVSSHCVWPTRYMSAHDGRGYRVEVLYPLLHSAGSCLYRIAQYSRGIGLCRPSVYVSDEVQHGTPYYQRGEIAFGPFFGGSPTSSGVLRAHYSDTSVSDILQPLSPSCETPGTMHTKDFGSP